MSGDIARVTQQIRADLYDAAKTAGPDRSNFRLGDGELTFVDLVRACALLRLDPVAVYRAAENPIEAARSSS